MIKTEIFHNGFIQFVIQFVKNTFFEFLLRVNKKNQFAYAFSNVFSPAILTELKSFRIAGSQLDFTPTTPLDFASPSLKPQFPSKSLNI
jgi:hypothetical protein